MAQRARSLYYPVLQELSAIILLQFDIRIFKRSEKRNIRYTILEYLDKLIFVQYVFILPTPFLLPCHNYNVVIEYNGQFKFQWTLVSYTFINISLSLISFRIMSAIGRAIKLNTHPQRHNPLIFCLNRNFISTCDKNTNGSFMTMKKKIKIDSRKYLNFTTPFKGKYKDNEVQYGKLLTFNVCKTFPMFSFYVDISFNFRYKIQNCSMNSLAIEYIT